MVTRYLNIVFQVIFSAECFFKIMAMGLFVGEKTYLRDGWNCLDLFIVLTGMVEYLPTSDAADGSVLRSFRLLRPLRALRAVARFKNLRILVEMMIGCVPMLANVFGLISFIFFVFGIFGVQIWGGSMRGRCYSRVDGLVVEASDDGVCGKESTALCGDQELCMLLGSSPKYGLESFDDIASAMMIIFQVCIAGFCS